MSERPYIVVVGAVNTDIGGISFESFKRYDSNPGSIVRSFGGVGHNIAYNIALLGIPVKFITAFGDQSTGVRFHCEKIGLDTAESLSVPGEKSSSYLYINDNNGETVAAISDMKIYENITAEFIAEKTDVLNGAQAVALDTNIPAETIEYIVRHCTSPVVCNTVSSTKAVKVKGALSELAAITANRYEAEILTGIEITDFDSAITAAKLLIDTGVKRVFITLGKDGTVCADSDDIAVIPSFVKEPVNVNGAGDAFCAAVTVSLCGDVDAMTAGRFGSAAAAVTAMYDGSVDPQISMARIREYLK